MVRTTLWQTSILDNSQRSSDRWEPFGYTSVPEDLLHYQPSPVDGRSYTAGPHAETPWCQRAEIHFGGAKVGELAVCYRERKPEADEGPFLKEERRLITALADRVGASIIRRRLRSTHESLQTAIETISAEGKMEWSVVLDFLRRTDPRLLVRITRKLINHLC